MSSCADRYRYAARGAARPATFLVLCCWLAHAGAQYFQAGLPVRSAGTSVVTSVAFQASCNASTTIWKTQAATPTRLIFAHPPTSPPPSTPQENDALLELYIANGGNGSAANGKAAADSCRLCKVASKLGLSGQQGQGQQQQGQELVPRPPSSDGGEPSPQASSLSGAAGAGVSAQVARELATRSETVTPWYWGLLTLLKVRSLACLACCYCKQFTHLVAKRQALSALLSTALPVHWTYSRWSAPSRLSTSILRCPASRVHHNAVHSQYRSGHNYRSGAWLGARVADKLLISLVILTLYLGVGDNLKPDNLINVQSALFMWALLPAFGAASYVPAIVLGE